MHIRYQGVITRFLREDERFVLSEEKEMPLVIEANDSFDSEFLKQLLISNSNQILEDIARYGAVLLRGFDIKTDEEFEKIILSIPEFQGISDVFMSEHGRVHVDHLRYVLHTNSVYKTGGTLYLGGFHTENYYSADVPSYLCFCCFQPSILGGETGLINTQKIYSHLSETLKQKLEKNTFFVCKWSTEEVISRYQISKERLKNICTHYNLQVVGEENHQFILMYKPSVLQHPLTREKALQINMFELKSLNYELRKHFMNDYQGNTWFWHRLFWKLPTSVFNVVEFLAVMSITFLNSPKKSYHLVRSKLINFIASRKAHLSSLNTVKVGTCFNDKEVKELAQLMRQHYSSCLWKKGDILLIDNKKVMHAGMPGKGPRAVRTMICNPIEMNYSASASGCLMAKEHAIDALGACLAQDKMMFDNKLHFKKQNDPG